MSHVLALQHSDLRPEAVLARVAVDHPNMMLLGPNAAVIHGKWGTWRLAEPADKRTAPFLDLSFDSDAEPEPFQVGAYWANELGDFNRFCEFLVSMG